MDDAERAAVREYFDVPERKWLWNLCENEPVEAVEALLPFIILD